MSIEQEIKQSKWRNEHEKCLVNLIFTYNWIKDQLTEILNNADLTMQQYNILRILRGSKVPLSTLQIRDRMLDRMSDTSRIVDRLLGKEMVSKSTSKIDKRLVDIIITDKGRAALAMIDSFEKDMDHIIGGLNIGEAQKLNELLDKLRK
jgi:DNA-binding MarR family transcriptional regulator